MVFTKTNVIAILLASSFFTTAFGQSASWRGTWTLDSNSQEAKPELTFTSKSDGTYELVFATAISRFRCDGKPYPRLSRTGQSGIGDVICTSVSNTSLDVTFQPKDERPSVGYLRVSGDAKGLTYTLETSDPSGKKQVKVRHYARLSGSGGLVGGWKNIDPNPSQVLNLSLSQQAIIMEFPLEHHVATLPLSGAEIHPVEDGVLARNTQCIQFIDPYSFRLANLVGGVVVQRADFSLSLDGSIITERFWLDQHPESVAAYTYRRSH